jgi:ureidoglycolate hydrolase
MTSAKQAGRPVRARVEKLTPQSFSPFGRVVRPPARDPDAEGPGWRWWAEIAALTGDGTIWGLGYLVLEPAALRFDWAEHHSHTQEAVIATSADLLIYVAPPGRGERASSSPDPSKFRVFRLPARTGVVLDRGVWHGAPLAIETRTAALVLLLEGTGHSDVTLSRFAQSPVEIEVEGVHRHG